MSLDPSTIIPERAVSPAWAASRWATIRTWSADTALAVLVNLAVLVFVGRYGLADHSVTAPDAISIEIVNEAPAGAKSDADAPANGSSQNRKAADTSDHETKAASGGPDQPKPADQPKPEPPPESPQPPAAPASTEKAPDTAAEPTPATPVAAAPPDTPDQTPAAPAPLKTEADGEAKPHLVEAPTAPLRAETQTETNTQADAEPDTKPEDKPADVKPTPVQPPVQSSAANADTVPTPAPVPPEPVEQPTKPAMPQLSPAERQRQARATAMLAAALPFSQTFAPDPFRASLSGQGDAVSTAYRGAVYGNLQKAADVIQRAKARHLTGQVVVAFSIDDTGNLTGLQVAVSSGNPEVDATALDYIRRSAPFPPPPPGAQRNFSPAIRLGLD